MTTPDGGRVAPRGLASWLALAAPATARGDVTVALVSDRRMQALNRMFRGKDYATDVLSFPVDEGGGAPPRPRSRGPSTTRSRHPAPPSTAAASAYLGDIVIAVGVARRQAKEAGHALATELKVLSLHGLLHLLGYDHDTDDGLMARTEARLRKKTGLKEGLIERGARLAPPRHGVSR